MKLKLPFIGEIEIRKETDEERKARVEKEFRDKWLRAAERLAKK